jgi:hypothetical protein
VVIRDHPRGVFALTDPACLPGTRPELRHISARAWQTKEDTAVELLALLLTLLVGFGAYYVSLVRNPWVTCSRCKGKPKSQGWLFGYAHRICSKCNGTGQQLRLGSKVFGVGPGKNPG